jgi:hypothetical protein
MKAVDILIEYWPMIIAFVGLGYFIVKLAIRNAVLEVLHEIDESFVKTGYCDMRCGSINKRLENLEDKL